MIELSIADNQASYNVQLFPPLFELTNWESKKTCIRELSLNFNLSIGDILIAKEHGSSHQIYFKKSYLGTGEIFEVNIGYDSILLSSQNFKSLDDIVNKFIIVLNAAFNKDKFSPKFQTITYQANANITKGNIKDYFDKLVTFQLILPSEIKSRAVVFIFDGPTERSNIQMILGNSQNVPDGLYLSAQVSFPDETDKYDKLFTISKEFIKNTVFPAFEIQINENTGEE
jgi:hypothetical protein